MTDTHADPQSRCIEIPEATADALERRLDGTEFESIDEYATFALEQLLDQLHRHDTTDGAMQVNEDDMETGQQDDAVADRLESLGYL